jgi:hypothetical protein
MSRARRLFDRARRRRSGAGGELALLRRELRTLRKEMKQARRDGQTAQRHQAEQLERIVDILRLLHDEEPATRRELHRVREQPDYELAFTEPEPLVSVVIPTYDRADALVERSIPSVLAQTYSNVELLVIGDGAPESVASAVHSFDDPRVTYTNRTLRGPYPADLRGLRATAGGPPYNEGVRRARGRWIAPLADDDAFRPDHVEVLLSAARQLRHELCYGRLRCLLPDGSERQLGDFPPRRGSYYAQASLYHSALRFMEAQLGDALFREASDISLCRRMLRAGVRVGFVNAVVTDYWWKPSHEGAKPPKDVWDNRKPPLA